MVPPESGKRRAPRIVLSGTVLAEQVAEQLRGLGWDVHTATDTNAAVKMAMKKNSAAILLPVAGADGESGYLTCAKLRKAKPRLKVLLVTTTRSEQDIRLAGFVGATLVNEASAADEVAKLVV